MSAPWWHPESNPLADVRAFMKAAEQGVALEDIERERGAVDHLERMPAEEDEP